MNFESFVQKLISLKINVNVAKAMIIWNWLNMDGIQADLEWYREEHDRLNTTIRDLDSENARLRNDKRDDLARLREKLTGESQHDYLVKKALGDKNILDSVRDGKTIQAIRDLRDQTQCGIREAKDAVEDRRVIEEANLAKVAELRAERLRSRAAEKERELLK